ncbi:C40 family peptidase [Xanthomarina sp.]|uniref:C40 family peptidase n=1 Tax=Xanthomarina sp. TaxID=1931211 RepID=UPI0025802BBF|nr:C40 family peptidase [Xanthomarina sp.]|tara:strand:+ start:1940 stop:2488 length:549 start_codon:yes stop_codon:yes gene_type:complete
MPLKINMRKTVFLLCLLLSLSACKSSKKTAASSKKTTRTTAVAKKPNNHVSPASKASIENIIKTAEKYNGVRYKYGGSSKKGMDCSGLITTAYSSENILLPRTTGALATTGNWVDVKEVQKGDLLFFATQKNSRNINHVGLVTEARSGYVEFIHSTTSSGVITSRLSEKYWYFAFVQARRIL